MQSLIAKACTVNGYPYWVVREGPDWTGGKERKRYFKQRRDAKAHITDLEQQRQRLGDEARNAPLELIAEALVCEKRLTAAGATLTTATDFYLKHGCPAKGNSKLQTLCDKFLLHREHQRKCRPSTLREYRSKVGIFANEFGKTECRSVTRPDIEDWIEELEVEARTKIGYAKTLFTLFEFGRRRGYLVANPAADLELPLCDEAEVGTLAPDQIERLLQVAVADGAELVPALATGIFGGARRSEVFALVDTEVDFDQRLIEIKGIKAKTRRRRLVTMNDTLMAWLAAFPPPKGRLVPLGHIDTFGVELRRLAKLAGIEEWPHNALRHTFGSNFLACTQNENRCAAEMGNTPDVVVRHYRALVKPLDAARFWAIRPPPPPKAQAGA